MAEVPSNALVVRHLREMQFEVEHAGWKLLVDMPKEFGGSGKVPSPPDLFLASLAVCKAIFGLSYADQQGLDVAGFEILAEPTLVAAPKRFGKVKLTFKGVKEKLGGKLEGFKRAAEGCTIANSLKQPPTLETVYE